jgi:hypothetical protein
MCYLTWPKCTVLFYSSKDHRTEYSQRHGLREAPLSASEGQSSSGYSVLLILEGLLPTLLLPSHFLMTFLVVCYLFQRKEENGRSVWEHIEGVCYCLLVFCMKPKTRWGTVREETRRHGLGGFCRGMYYTEQAVQKWLAAAKIRNKTTWWINPGHSIIFLLEYPWALGEVTQSQKGRTVCSPSHVDPSL